MVIGCIERMVFAGITDRGEEVDITPVPFSCRNFVIGFQLTAADILGKRIVFLRFLQHDLVDHPQRRRRLRQDRLYHLLLTQTQKSTKLEHIGIEAGLCLRQFSFHL